MKFLGLLGLLGIAASTLPAQSTVTVEGAVVDSVTGAGISGCTVRLVFVDGMVNVLLREVLTNEVGIFQAAGLKPGDYTALAQKQGYSGTHPVQFHVNADGSPIRPRLELTPPATLRGRVLGIDGKPVKASVELGPGARERVSTDEDGYFTFEQLTPGSYTLLGRPETAEPVSTREGSRTEVAPTYYPSTLDRVQAESIAVRAGAEHTGYEIRLQSAPVYRVSGVVLDPGGKPAPDALVQLGNGTAARLSGFSNGHQVFSIRSSPFTDVPDATQSTTTGDDGEFEFPSVPAGDWTLRAESDSIRDEIHQQDVVGFGSATISLGGRDLDDVRIQLVLPVDLSGSVEGTDAPPDAGRSVAVTLTGENGNSGGSAHADANGALRFEGVIPGRYLISSEASGDYYASVLMGSSDVTGQTVELASSSPPMRVVLKKGGTIRWSLEKSDSWEVVLVPQSLTGLGYCVLGIPSGGFLTALAARPSELTGIPPGEYYMIALDRFNPRTMADAPRLRELVPRAVNVRVEAGSVSAVQLKINHAPD